jgi:hypothetical protein
MLIWPLFDEVKGFLAANEKSAIQQDIRWFA